MTPVEMETADVMRKSVLKKSNKIVNKGKKVSFCNTVKLFIEDEDSKVNENEEKLKCVEISIVDNKKENLAIISDSLGHDDCSITDFLVHKVVYENGIASDDDVETPNDETEENLLYSEASEEEDLEFVVHKVTEHEDDLIQQELEFEDSNLENENESKNSLNCNELVISKFSKLSVENILVHDKIIAFIDQKKLSLPSDHILSSKLEIMPDFSINKDFSTSSFDDLSSIKNTELILSPPLQELSLKKIVEAQSDNVLCELDISPLNSIQETDSESDISSEGTMIMMTSEECEKNEQHIRESLMQYESLKEKLSKSEGDTSADDSSDSLNTNAQAPEESTKIPEDVHCESVPSLEDVNTKSVVQKTFGEETEEISVQKSFMEYDEKSPIQTELYELPSNKLVNFDNRLSKPKHFFQAPVANLEEENSLDLNYVHAIRKASLRTPNNTSYWEKSLSSVEIPKDVREWKIFLSRLNKNSDGIESCHQQSRQSYETDTGSESSFCSRGGSDSSKFASSVEEFPSSSKSDELENFVHQSTERVERIRNRYLLKNKPRVDFGFVRNTSVRGIRPRFGSTAEILQRMQEQNLPHFSASSKTHLSWPCHETRNPEFGCSQIRQPSSYYFSQNISGEYSSQACFRTHEKEQLVYCDHNSSCPSIFLQERGTPEGASPPRSLSGDSIEQSFVDDNPNSVVYYSMKV